MVTIKDANRKEDRKVRTHEVPADSAMIKGYYDPSAGQKQTQQETAYDPENASYYLL
jgi:hypothetical protein